MASSTSSFTGPPFYNGPERQISRITRNRHPAQLPATFTIRQMSEMTILEASAGLNAQ